jgi:predicted transcriptional regulator
MRRPGLVDASIDLALGLAVALAAVVVVSHARGARLELGHTRLVRLDDALAQRLADLPDRVEITYFVSPRDQMPSHMRRVESEVTGMLEAMADAAEGRLHYQIVDPTSDPGLLTYAAKRKATPVRVRSVSRDSWTEQEVWSTLTISHGPRPPAVVRGLGPEHLPRLQSLVMAHLDELAAPTQTVFAFAAPPGHDEVRSELALKGSVIDVDLSAGEALPAEADLLVWLAPGAVGADTLRELDRFLDRGRSMVVAGAEARAQLLGQDAERQLVLAPTGFEAQTLWGHFGLAPAGDLLLDERNRALDGPEGERTIPAPHRITCIANNQDFQQLAYECNATLLFEAPSALRVDAQALGERGWRADVLATSSERAWARPWEGKPIPFSDLPAKTDDKRPKEPLVVWLRHADPWRGQVAALAADTPFRDENFRMSGTGHPKLLNVLVDTLASPTRRVQGRAEIRRADPLPPLDPGSRVGWRAFTVLVLPLGLALVAWRRRVAAGTLRSGTAWGGLVLRGLGAFVVLGVLVAFAPGRADLTADGRNLLHPATIEHAGSVGEAKLELVFSGPELLPPSLRSAARRLGSLANDLAREVPELSLARVRPEDLDDAGREALEARGVEPVKVTSHAEESTTVRTVWGAVVVSAGDRQEVLPFTEEDAFEHAEFRLACAFWRLATGRRPVVAVAADNPRLSAAEAHEEFQKKGLIAPTGTDAYSVARHALELVDLEVIRIDPRNPSLEQDVDALVWFQPRRSVSRMLGILAEHLYRGGRALLAVQHFNIQARQYSGRGYDFVHWPQPQSPDVEALWFPEFGVELVREVLFDTLNLPIADKAQIAGKNRRDFETMQSSLPFVIRAVGAGFLAGSPITAGLGDQAFIWGSFLRLDEQRLAEAGLTAKVLMTTSEQAWSFLWSGGWLPFELLEGPPIDEAGEPQWAGRLPLAVDLEGSFPWPRTAFSRTPGADGPEAYPEPEPVDEQRSGRLVIVGSSEVFKNNRLVGLRPEFRGDHLLLNVVADLALGDGLPEVLTRRDVSRGFDVLDEDERLRWRATVVLALPVLLLGLGLLRPLFGRRR